MVGSAECFIKSLSCNTVTCVQHRAVFTAREKKIMAIAVFTVIISSSLYQFPNPNSLWPFLMLLITQSGTAILPVKKENIHFLIALICLIFLGFNVDLFEFHTLNLRGNMLGKIISLRKTCFA